MPGPGAGTGLPVTTGSWKRGDCPLRFVERLGSLDLLGDGIPVGGYGGMSNMVTGLVNMEISHSDRSMGTLIAVQGRTGAAFR